MGGRRGFSLVSDSVIQDEKSQRETPKGLPAGRKRKRSNVYWAFTLGNSQFRCFSQVVSLRGSCYHPLVMKEETEAAGRKVTQRQPQSWRVVGAAASAVVYSELAAATCTAPASLRPSGDRTGLAAPGGSSPCIHSTNGNLCLTGLSSLVGGNRKRMYIRTHTCRGFECYGKKVK